MKHSSLSAQPKAKAAYDALLQIIDTLEPNAKLSSTGVLRTQLGVSVETLNLALRELERERRIYSVRGVGIFVAPQHQLVLLCESSLFNTPEVSPFWQMLVDEIFTQAKRQGESLTLHFTRPSAFRGPSLPDELQRDIEAQRIEAQRVAGMIIIGADIKTVQSIEQTGMPVVGIACVSRWTVGLYMDEVARGGARELARRGCRRIALMRPQHQVIRSDTPVDNDVTLQVFCQTLADAGLPLAPSEVTMRNLFFSHPDPFVLLPKQEQGRRLTKTIFQETESRPDGIVVMDDMMTVGVLEALAEWNIVVGRDVLIASHSNAGSPVLQDYEARLILLEYRMHEVVEAIFQMVEAFARGEKPPQRESSISPHLRAPASLRLMR